jgi:hypothetical protein
MNNKAKMGKKYTTDDVLEVVKNVDETLVKSLENLNPENANIVFSIDTDEKEGGITAKIVVEISGIKKAIPIEDAAARIIDDARKRLEEKLYDIRAEEDPKKSKAY